MKFADLDLKSVGNEVQLVGGIWAGKGKAYLLYFPEYGEEFPAEVVELDHEDWKALLQQSDVVETEVLSKLEDGTLYKAVVRKCTRTVDQQVTWNCFRRDGFRCRYCGKDDVPLTIDHLVLWEDGGPTIEKNLLSACRKCNKTRGRMKYPQWLDSRYYREVSKGLSAEVRQANLDVSSTLDALPLVVNVRSRK